jgi:hypothetical protein
VKQLRQSPNVILTLLLTASASGCEFEAMSMQGSAAAAAPDTEQVQALAREAYLWGFPIVMNYKTMYNYVLDEASPEYKGPFNEVACEARVFTPADRAVVTPNADTPYCMFWMDLRAEPLVLTVPEMEPERFYHFQLIDLYTHNFAYVGTLTTGNDAGRFLLAGPDWDGEAPAGIEQVIRSETGIIFNVTRTQLFDADDIDNVREIQDAYELEPLSAFVGEEAPPAEPTPDFPQWEEGSQFDARFFNYLDVMMDLLEEPPAGREQLWADLGRLGIGAEGPFEVADMAADTRAALEAGVKEGFAEIEAFIAENAADPLGSAKMFGTRAFLTESAGENYGLDRPDMLRSAMAHMGLYGNSGAEAVYPTYLTNAEGEPLDASKHDYNLTFAKGELPPVKAFWSLTMYDGTTQLFIENPLDRYLLNSTMEDDFVREEDGSLTLYIGHEPPGEELEPNWLPAPDGPFYMVLRLYGPEEEALSGAWSPPTIETTSMAAGASSEPSSQGEPVTVANFVRAESDHMIRVAMQAKNLEIGEIVHAREPRTAENQSVIRENQDTLYSSIILDLSKPVTLTLPEIGGRYMSMQVVNQDHYMLVKAQPGAYELTEGLVGTRFATVIIRTFVDVNDPTDVAAAHAAQDAITVSGGGDGPFEAPDWDVDDLAVIRKALNDVAALGFEFSHAFGTRESTRPVDYLIGAAAGWGGLPRTAAFYITGSVDANDGMTAHVVTVKDVPVDAFWSITVYNADGYLEANDLGVNSYNNFSAEPNDDGSITIHFGGCNDDRVNCIPITPGWNYAIRMYQPRQEILDGEWTFPAIEPVE